MLGQLKNHRFYLALAADFVIFVVAFIGAYLLRFDFTVAEPYRSQIWRILPLVLPGKILIFFMFGLYKGMWRYTSLNDLWRLALASLLSMLFYFSATFLVFGLKGIPRSAFLLDAILTLIMSGGLRVGIRLYHVIEIASLWPLGSSSVSKHGPRRKSVVIVGAGGAGEKMLREIFDNSHLDYHVVGFLDDDRGKWGRSLHGLNVLGGVEKLSALTERLEIDEVLIATPRANGAQMRRILEICKHCKVRYRTLPGIGAIIDGKVSIKNLRDVKYEDLLRREPVDLDCNEIRNYLKGKRVLVTGAGGSIGSELCRQIIRFDPEELILLDSSEENLFTIQMELRHELKFSSYRSILCLVQDQSLMDYVFRCHRPQIVFHAAAYKHVPMLEENPWVAISNNVLGTQVIMDLALKYQVARFVLVSTDKAVQPTNVMGASKRLAELMLQSRQGNGVRFMAVRFGNVIGSSGSVLPIFRRQLERGGPLTVTHPEVTRYFMTIPEAAQLILQAGGLGEGGEIFILEMGLPVKIAQMAEELVRLSGKEPGKDVEIVFTGLRDGEKLYEELITQGEGIVNTKHEKILVLRANNWNGQKNQVDFSRWLHHALEDLYRIAQTHDADAIKGKLIEVLPGEYLPQQPVKSGLGPKSPSVNAAQPVEFRSPPDSKAVDDAPQLPEIQIPTRQLKVS